MSDSPVEHALSHLLSGAPDAALRWGAAALEADPGSPAALLAVSRALARIGRRRAAVDGFTAAATQGAVVGDAPIAVAAIAELRALGVGTEKLLAEVALMVCREPEPESPWTEAPAWRGSTQPVSPLLTRRALASRATQLVYEARAQERPQSTATALLGALSPAAFRELAAAFETILVPAGYRVLEEDGETRDLFVVASGQVEISRRGARFEARSLATLESGAVFGEMSLLARLPSASSAITTRPTVLLFASRAKVEEIGARHRDLRLEIGAHCRRQAVGNLGSASPFITTVPVRDRGALVDRMISRVYARGERLVRAGEEAAGVHVILAGQVALVGHDGSERVLLSTLTAGDVVGEAELVLCRRADTEAVAAGPAATLFLPRDEFFALALDYPAILHGLYAAAVRRMGETGDALQAGTAAVADADVQLEELAFVPAREEAPPEAPPSPPESPAYAPEPEPAPASEAPRVTVARVRAPSLPPPLRVTLVAPDAEVPAPSSAGVVARGAPSLAPVVTSSAAPPPPSATRPAAWSRGSFVRRSAQGAALVAVAASVAAVLATHEEPSALSLPHAGSPAPEEPSSPRLPSVLPAPPASAVLATAPASPVAPSATPPASAPPRAPAPLAHAPTPAQSTRAFLTSSLKKRPPPPRVERAVTPDDDDDAPAPAASVPSERAAPAASAARLVIPPPLPSAPPAPQPDLPGDTAFGGRE